MSQGVSLYKPVEITIGEKTFTVRKLNRQMFRVLEDFRKKEETIKSEAERIDNLYDQVAAFVTGPKEVIDDLDVDELTQVMKIIQDVISRKREEAKQQTAEEQAEKNGPRPGDEVAAS